MSLLNDINLQHGVNSWLQLVFLASNIFGMTEINFFMERHAWSQSRNCVREYMPQFNKYTEHHQNFIVDILLSKHYQ